MGAESRDSFTSEIKFSVFKKIPMPYVELSVDGRWLEHLATAQKQLVIRYATIIIFNMYAFSSHQVTSSHPPWLWISWFVDKSEPWNLGLFKNVCAYVLSGCSK